VNPGASGRRSAAKAWPELPLDSWRDTYATLHMWLQIVGKTRLALAPSQNHWWQAALYVTPRGLTTSSIPLGNRTFAVDLDFLDHHLYVRTSDGAVGPLPLTPQSVAEFFACYFDLLRSMGLSVGIYPVPVEVETAIPFAADREHAAYDASAANRCWRILVQTDRVLKCFRGEFTGKSSPVHFFWGGFDLAATRFSGRPAPLHPGGVPNCPAWVMEQAYTHECSSCGFWPGGGVIAEPAFYAYAYPTPAQFGERRVQPDAAFYSQELGEFILPYEAVRTTADPDEMLLAFFRSTYAAAADLGGWDRAALERQPKP
jgi:hypothetical protein